MEIKPIETHYNGYRFRSRLEARWAVFFDALGIKYEYESEGYDLKEAGWYLPDFWLPIQEVFFEVKGSYPTDSDMCKMEALALNSEKGVVLAWGNDFRVPDTTPYTVIGAYLLYIDPADPKKQQLIRDRLLFVECPLCNHISLDSHVAVTDIYCVNCDMFKPDRIDENELAYFHKGHVYFKDGVLPWSTPRLCSAYGKARSARFEHGCSGGV